MVWGRKLVFSVVFGLCFFLSAVASAESNLERLFKVKKPIIAALFLPVPTAEKVSDEAFKREQIAYAKSQMRTAREGGVDAVLWEFRAGDILTPKVSPAQLGWMVDVIKAVIANRGDLQVGVELLWHYPEETLKLAALSGASFVRIDFFSDQMIAEKKEVAIDPEGLIKYKKSVGADNVFLFTDIQVKYATMVDPKITIDQSATRALSKGSDGVIVSGAKSGQSPDTEKVRLAKVGAGKHDVIIGSGFSHTNAEALLAHADGVIVGTAISEKTGGPLLPEKVAALMKIVKQHRSK